MKNNYSTMAIFRFLHVMLVGVVVMFLCPLQIQAKLKVMKPAATTSLTKSIKPSSKPLDRLYCLGYKTLIVNDAGQTKVYVNDDGGDYSTEEKYLVSERSDGSAIDWDRTEIYAGDSYSSTYYANIKMTGGNINSIYMTGYGGEANITGVSKLTITGGRVSYISLYDETAPIIEAYLSGLRYTGSRPVYIRHIKDRLTLFINTDCEFYAEAARLTEADCSADPEDEDDTACKGVVAPCADDPNSVFAMGAAYVPSNMECDYFYDRGYTSLSVASDSRVDIKKCNGWKSEQSMPMRMYKADHNEISYVYRQASCTQTERTRTYCDLCGEYDNTLKTANALGHNYVTDEAIAATCVAPGLSAGSHCSRCGLVKEEQTVVAARNHSVALNARQIQIDFVNQKIRRQTTSTTWGSWESWPSSASGTLTKMSNCYSGIVTFTGQCTRCSTYVSSTEPQHGTIVAKSLLDKKKRLVSCTKSYTIEGTCSKCGLDVPKVMSALNHVNRTKVTGVAATCTEVGRADYWECNNCSQKFKDNSNDASYKFTDMSDVEIAPLGHLYGVDASKKTSGQAWIDDATCTSPAVYYQTCARCNKISDNLIWYEGSALGHNYRVQSNSLRPSTDQVDEGTVTIECSRSGCGKTWPSFQYIMADKVGDGANGYWTKVELIETTKLPTCVPGWGKYKLTMNFHGQTLSPLYFENNITPCGHLHNYDDEGVCHEKHYVMTRINTIEGNVIKKTYSGDIEYKVKAVNYEETKVDDNNVYTSFANIVIPHRRVAMSVWNQCKSSVSKYEGTPLVDPETGENMTYQDYKVIEVNDKAELLAVLDTITVPCYVNYYRDLDLNVAEDDVEAYLSAKSNGSVSMNPHDHNCTAKILDKTTYNRASSLSLPDMDFCYLRNFTQSDNWETMYAPISFYPSAYSSVCDVADIYSFGVMSDTNGDGVMDSKDDTWLIVDLMTDGFTEPNYPYLIRAKQQGNIYFGAIDEMLYPSSVEPVSCATTRCEYTFKGSYTQQNLSASANRYNMVGGVLTPNTSAVVDPQRWYLEASQMGAIEPALSNGIRVMVIGEDISEETAIQLLQGESVYVWQNGERYMLDGRKATTTQSGLQILNGKTIMIKK